VLTIIAVGAFFLVALSILCFAAYKIRAREFEFSTMIWRFVSFKITIRSPEVIELGKQSAPGTALIGGPGADGGES
jgi:hypothetical protein